MSKIYLFGGSFDPFHIGHEAMVNSILKEYGKILIVPTHNPWKPKGLLSLSDRIEVLKEFYKDNKNVEVSDLCLKDEEYNYMYKFVEHYKDNKIIFVMGEDAFQSFHLWKNYNDFSDKVEPLVFKRNRDGMNLPNAPRIRVLPSNLYQNDISSTVCRKNLDKNKNFIPHKMFELIKNKLSKENA